jgi:hypothetical protein
MESEQLHKITTEMHGLLDGLAGLLKRRESLTELSQGEIAGYEQRNERLRELSEEMNKLTLEP